MLEDSQTPTQTSVKDLLDTFRYKEGQEHDLLYYMVGFTHYKETSVLLKDYGIAIDTDGIVYNPLEKALYTKILVSDPDWSTSKQIKIYLTEQGHSLRQNYVKLWNRTLAQYLDRYQPLNTQESFLEYNKNLQENYEMSLEEEVQLYQKHQGDFDIFYCFAYPSAYNIAINIERLLNHVRFVLCAPTPDKMPNVSLHRLMYYYTNPRYSFQKPLWILLRNSLTDSAKQSIENAGMSCYIVEAQTPENILRDVVAIVNQDLSQRFSILPTGL